MGEGGENKHKDTDTVMESVAVIMSRERRLSNAYVKISAHIAESVMHRILRVNKARKLCKTGNTIILRHKPKLYPDHCFQFRILVTDRT